LNPSPAARRPDTQAPRPLVQARRISSAVALRGTRSPVGEDVHWDVEHDHMHKAASRAEALNNLAGEVFLPLGSEGGRAAVLHGSAALIGARAPHLVSGRAERHLVSEDVHRGVERDQTHKAAVHAEALHGLGREVPECGARA